MADDKATETLADKLDRLPHEPTESAALWRRLSVVESHVSRLDEQGREIIRHLGRMEARLDSDTGSHGEMIQRMASVETTQKTMVKAVEKMSETLDSVVAFMNRAAGRDGAEDKHERRSVSLKTAIIVAIVGAVASGLIGWVLSGPKVVERVTVNSPF